MDKVIEAALEVAKPIKINYTPPEYKNILLDIILNKFR